MRYLQDSTVFVTDNLQSKTAKALDIRTPLCYNRQCKERYLTHSSIFFQWYCGESCVLKHFYFFPLPLYYFSSTPPWGLLLIFMCGNHSKTVKACHMPKSRSLLRFGTTILSVSQCFTHLTLWCVSSPYYKFARRSLSISPSCV